MAVNLTKSKVHFAWDVLNKLKTGDDSLFCSPVSILGAFSMLLVGAKGQSEKDLKSALMLTGSDAQLHTEIGKLLEGLVKGADDVIIKLANRAYVQDGFQLLDDFTKTLRDTYKAEIGMVDFKQSEACCAEINRWVEDQTNQKIKDLVSPSGLPKDTQLLLVNAIYFKGGWMKTFNPGKTTETPFHVTASKTEKVQMMFDDGFYDFAKDAQLGCKMLSLNFANDRFTMLVILPDKLCGLAELEGKLSGDAIAKMIGQLEPIALEMSLPRFRVESSLDLGSAMKELGAGSVFDKATADLSGISSAARLFVSKAVHKSFLAVNEEGAEAAAATGMFCEPMCLFMGQENFFVNHPFLVAIYDKTTATIAFIGRVTHPKE